jgi:C-methyltransferase
MNNGMNIGTDNSMYTAELEAAARVKELALGLCVSAMMMAATKLRVADVIDDEPLPVNQVAAEVNADPETLGRLLRALACHGVFVEAPIGRFGHTDLSRLLREDHPFSVRYQVLWTVEPWTWHAWPHLDDAIRTGKPVFSDLFGKDFFAYLTQDAPDSAAVFNRAMTQSSTYTSEAIADVLDIGDARTVADIGGGEGNLLRTLLDRHLGLRGVLLDLPSATAKADPALRPDGRLADRAAIMSGNCLHGVPVDADIYVLKNLLEWDDDKTVTTLRNVVATARPGARVVLIQNLVDSSPEMKVTTAMDMLLLINVGGRKHTRQHLVDLTRRSGLNLTGIKPTRSSLFLLETVVPADAVPAALVPAAEGTA